ncbi:MAG: histidine phosphatase family protein [Microbacterium sp.]
MTLITLVRHGQTDWNLNGRIQGRTDIPLNDTGRDQARDAAASLLDRGHTLVVASPLSRAFETASIIATELGLDAPLAHPGLIERDYGIGEGMSDADIEREMTERGLTVRAFFRSPPGGEDDAAVAARAVPALREIAAHHEGPVIAVAHGAFIRVALEQAGGHGLGPIVNGSAHDILVDDETFEHVPDGLRDERMARSA